MNHKLRKALVSAVAAGAALTGALAFGIGTATAAPADPPGGATPVYPHFYNGNVEAIRNAGSDTTIFMMQQIDDLYTSAGLYGCTLDNATGQSTYNTSDPTVTSSNLGYYCQSQANVSTTDVNDNWDRTEVYTGVDGVGSSIGQAQLCGETDGAATNFPSSPLTVDFSRSSKPSDNLTGCAEQEVGYAKDGVDPVAFPELVPATIGKSTFSVTAANGFDGYANVNGGSGLVGPVDAGWLPGDPTSGPYSGTPFTDIDNTVNGTVSQSSVAYNLWCNNNTATGKISDWGQLTNLGPNVVLDQVVTSTSSPTITLATGASFASTIGSGDTLTSSNVSGLSGLTVVSNDGTSLTLSGDPGTTTSTGTITVATGQKAAVGQGQSIGMPIRVIGLNTGSGTEATWQKFANSGPTSSGGCSSNADPNSATDPNPATNTISDYAGNQYLLENNVANVGLTDQEYFTNPVTQAVDVPDAAILVDSSLYYISKGVVNTNPYASSVTLNGTTYAAVTLTLDGQSDVTGNVTQNVYPTARTLFNIISQHTVRAPVAGFLNWLCDGNKAFTKATDQSTGTAYDTELGNIITGTFGFTRLTDSVSSTPSTNPLDGQAAPNNTCDANVPADTVSGSTTVTLDSSSGYANGKFPTSVSAGEGIVGTGIPSGTTVVSNNGSTLTLSNAATATNTNVQLNIPNEPPVLTYVNP